MSDKARETWAYVSGLLDQIGILNSVDALALEMMCEAYADYLGARRELEQLGSNYYETINRQSGATMHRAHPAVAVMQDADRRIKAWVAEFGMTPSARSRVKPCEERGTDAAEKYFSCCCPLIPGQALWG
jgi:P27 family predicted phage terminase small subunit